MSSPELLRSFIAAADTGSFSAAGRLIGKHQATISGNIARLEDELGVVLFDRVGKYPQITEQGLALYDSAKLVVESSERFNRNAMNLSSGIPVCLNLGIHEDLPLTPFQSVWATLRRAYPLLRVNLHRGSSEQLFSAVTAEQIDLALTPTLEGQSQSYEFRSIGQASILLVCGKQHPFASMRKVTNDHLLHNTQLVSKAFNSSTFAGVARMSADIWECQGYDALVEMTQANIGWCFLLGFPGQRIPDGLKPFKAEFAEVEFMIQFDLIWPKNHSFNEVEHLLAEQISTLFPGRD